MTKAAKLCAVVTKAKVTAAKRQIVRLERVMVAGVENWFWNHGLIGKRLLAFCPISALIPNFIYIKL